MEINLAIIGSRTFNNYFIVESEVNKILQDNNYTIHTVISGGAIGADTLAEKYCSQYNIPIKVIKPDWRLGKSAGMIRNTEIIKESDVIIAFWDNKSKGTSDSINKAKKLNKKIFIVKI